MKSSILLILLFLLSSSLAFSRPYVTDELSAESKELHKKRFRFIGDGWNGLVKSSPHLIEKGYVVLPEEISVEVTDSTVVPNHFSDFADPNLKVFIVKVNDLKIVELIAFDTEVNFLKSHLETMITNATVRSQKIVLFDSTEHPYYLIWPFRIGVDKTPWHSYGRGKSNFDLLSPFFVDELNLEKGILKEQLEKRYLDIELAEPRCFHKASLYSFRFKEEHDHEAFDSQSVRFYLNDHLIDDYSPNADRDTKDFLLQEIPAFFTEYAFGSTEENKTHTLDIYDRVTFRLSKKVDSYKFKFSDLEIEYEILHPLQENPFAAEYKTGLSNTIETDFGFYRFKINTFCDYSNTRFY